MYIYMYIYIYIYIHTHTHTGILFSLKEEWNIVICHKMDRVERHYVKWNKSDMERKVLSVSLSYVEAKIEAKNVDLKVQ
jgi:hypothetical protein